MTAFWRERPDGVSVTVKVQPKSRRPGIQGQAVSAHGPCLRIGVREAAEDGRANRAACAILAQALHVPAAAVTVTLGQTSRDKILQVIGDSALLSHQLEHQQLATRQPEDQRPANQPPANQRPEDQRPEDQRPKNQTYRRPATHRLEQT